MLGWDSFNPTCIVSVWREREREINDTNVDRIEWYCKMTFSVWREREINAAYGGRNELYWKMTFIWNYLRFFFFQRISGKDIIFYYKKLLRFLLSKLTDTFIKYII